MRRKKLTEDQLQEWASLLNRLADLARAKMLNDSLAANQAVQACLTMGWAVLIEKVPQ